ncbi:hypothetical protein V6Z11_D02G144000 [Gossypium hirsutum]
MSSDEEYYIIFHVDGCFVKDPYVRYVGGEVIRFKEDPDTRFYFELVKIGLGFNTVMLIYFHEPSTVRLQNNLSVIYDDTSTVAMLDFWVKFKQIDLYVEHEVDNLIIDSDEHGSLVGSDEDEEHEDGKRMSKFPLYNDKLKFSLGMLFKDGKQFKSEIRKYSKECRRQLKFIKNEPKMVVVRCIASPNCP